jgi:hypothetical protein
MTPGQLVISFFIAALLTVIFAGFLRAPGPWRGFWIFFIIMFFVALAASEWIKPVGSQVWGYYWIPGLFAALIFAVLLAAVTPKGPGKNKSKFFSKENKDSNVPNTYYSPAEANASTTIYKGDEPANRVVLGGFFWIFIIFLLIAVLAGAGQ